MSGLRHGWGKFHDNGHADFVHGGVPVDDFDEEIPYKKPSRSNFNNKRKRICKKSKNKEQCDFTVKVVSKWHDVMTCSRCGKHGQYTWKHLF